MSVEDYTNYQEPFTHYNNRFEKKYEKFTESFTSLTENTPVKDARSMITVGIADAVYDLMILKAALPNIDHVIAVEPDPKYNEIIPEAFETLKDRKIKLDIQNKKLEEYEGPDSQVDLILLANVLPFFMDTAEEQLAICHKWLKPGGHLVITLNTTTSLAEAYDGLQREGWHGAYNGTEVMKSLNVEYTDVRTADVLFDLREENIQHILYVLTDRKLSEEEIQIFMNKVKKFYIPGTNKIYANYSFYLVPKRQCSD